MFQNSKIIRPPIAAGAFYPDSPRILSSQINEFLKNAESMKAGDKSASLTDKPKIIIVPHAGYVYSGQVAAYAYQTIKGKDYPTVILIGSSHRAYFKGISVFAEGCFRTPLGEVEIDKEAAEEIIRENPERICFNPEVHAEEHSLEAQLPFLQKVLGGFKIIPILLGETEDEDCEALAEILAEHLPENSLVIASSDLSHYPNYSDAEYSDRKIIAAILAGDADKLSRTAEGIMAEGRENLQTCLCGEGAVKTAMILAGKMGLKARLLKYANSGDVTGDKSQVVGYAAIIFSLKND